MFDALVAKEDERFREHGGVDVWCIIKALWLDIRVSERVRTITQSYVKKAYLSQDHFIKRKVKKVLISR